jgi:hypothetical protein
VRPRDFLLLGALALLARAAAAVLVVEPPYLDPAYYELVARQLAAGNGFTTPALWSFLEVGGRLPEVPELPLPSNGHWMPLTSVVAAGSMALLGPSRLAAELPMVLIGAGLVPLTAFIGWEVWRSRRVAYVSGVLALFAGPMLVYVPLTDSFALFGLGGSIALYAAMRAVRVQDASRWLLVASVGVAIATLTRIDGLLLALAPAVAWLIRRGIGPWRTELRPLGWTTAVVCAGITLLLLAPWLIRQQLVFGTPFPSAGGHTLWITSYNEQFSIGHPVDPGTYLAPGVVAGNGRLHQGMLPGVQRCERNDKFGQVSERGVERAADRVARPGRHGFGGVAQQRRQRHDGQQGHHEQHRVGPGLNLLGDENGGHQDEQPQKRLAADFREQGVHRPS